MVLGVKSGIEPERLAEIVGGSSANSFTFQQFYPKVLKGDFKPGFILDLALKDVGLAMSLAKSVKLPVKMGGLGYQIIQEECAAGKGGMDFRAAVTTLEKLANVELRSK